MEKQYGKKTITVKVKKKNGDLYVEERVVQYDPEKKRNNILSTKLLGKIPAGETQMIPTRPKRPRGEGKTAGVVSATGTRTGMMDIIGHIGKVSGIDDAVYGATDRATARKIISLARYHFATGGDTFPGILTWQYSHPLPYGEGISEDVYHDLFESVGKEESISRSIFYARISAFEGK